MMGAETGSERPIINVEGERVALGPLRREHIPLATRWINDFAILRTIGPMPRPVAIEQQRAAYERSATADSRHADFTIYERAILPGGRLRPIGAAGWHDIDYRHRTAWMAIVIGEADARGKGYGTEVTRLLLDYAFTALGLHSVMLTVNAYNHAGQRAYAKAGFREFGRRRACRWMGGRFWDTVYMEALASEFVSPVLGHVFVPDASH